MENFILLDTFHTSIEAHNVKNHLESNGIPAEVIGEISSMSYNFFTQSNGGIRLYVHKDHEEAARKLMEKSSWRASIPD